MQNLPLPQIFCLRQLWLYEFRINDLKTSKSEFYSYCEGVANKGPNEVCTLQDYIKNIYWQCCQRTAPIFRWLGRPKSESCHGPSSFITGR